MTLVFVFVPLNAVCSLIVGKDSLSLNDCGVERMTDASPELKFPFKSRNLTTYSPSFAGTIASVEIPEIA